MGVGGRGVFNFTCGWSYRSFRVNRGSPVRSDQATSPGLLAGAESPAPDVRRREPSSRRGAYHMGLA